MAEDAFFDLDKTVIAKSSTLAFGRPFYKSGLLGRRSLLKAAFGQLIFVLFGADVLAIGDPARFGFCGDAAALCLGAAAGPWSEIQEAAEAAYLYYAVDESAQQITRAYRAEDPGANLMAQLIRTHRLEVRR